MRLQNVYLFIMAGGAGTRFWPLSTSETPKQFLPIFRGNSLLQMTLERLSTYFDPKHIYILTRSSYKPYIQRHYGIPARQIIGEAYPRDTAASVAIATYLTQRLAEDGVTVILPADHIITPAQSFIADLEAIIQRLERHDGVYTIGIGPTYPATVYGYLELGDPVADDPAFYRVAAFKEKPLLKKAQAYHDSGNYLWNAGIFLFRAAAMAGILQRLLPGHTRLQTAFQTSDDKWDAALADSMLSLEKISIDYAVMEKLDTIYSRPASFAWNDMGSWLAYRDYLSKDKQGNYTNLPVHFYRSADNTVYVQEPDEQVALIGVTGLVVVRADGKTLVCHRDHLQDIKRVTAAFDSKTGS